MAAMESRLARELAQELIAAMQRLTPEERLQAFLSHSRFMSELYEAGRRHRSGPAQQPKS
jgi:hypothetical protein